MSKLIRQPFFLLTVIAMVMLSGCLSSKNAKQTATGEQRPLPFDKGKRTRTAATFDDAPLGVEATVDKDNAAKDTERKVVFPERTSSRETGDALLQPYPDNLIKNLPDANAEVEVKAIFNAADISEVTAAFAAPSLLNFSYLIDPAVKGAVTFSVDTTMTAKQAWETFEHILWLSGAYASMNTGFIHILPFEKMPQERKLFAPRESQPNVVVDFIPIRYRKSADIINQIRPFITDGASVTDQTDANTLIIVEAPANIEKIRELINRLDNKGERDWPTGTYACSNVDADVLATELTSLLPVLGFPVATGTGTSGGAVKLIALPRVRCIVVSAALPEVVEEVGKWVKNLDRSDMMDKEEIFFYNVKHTTVDKLASALETFFNAATTFNNSSLSSNTGSSSSSSSRRSTNSTNNLSTSSSNTSNTTNNRRNTTSTANRGTNGNNTTNNATPQNLTVFETEVIVFADQESNRLTVKTTPRTWAVIQAFLSRHDVPPRQVAIKAIITDISLDKNTQFGVTYAATKMFQRNDIMGSGGWAGAGSPALLAGDEDANLEALQKLASNGINLILRKGVNDPLALINAVAGKGQAKVLSEPQLIVTSGTEGTFNNGQQIAVPTESTSYTSSSGNTSTNYEYKDIGVIMTVTPYITAGNLVQLTIKQEISSLAASSTNTNGTNAPNFNKKEVSTTLTVEDNTTILLGGMIQTTETTSRSGIPFLKDIPYLGILFGNDSTSYARSELLILVTVNVIDTENFQEELIRRYKVSLEEIAKHQQDEMY